jgi:hypothetical protein
VGAEDTPSSFTSAVWICSYSPCSRASFFFIRKQTLSLNRQVLAVGPERALEAIPGTLAVAAKLISPMTELPGLIEPVRIDLIAQLGPSLICYRHETDKSGSKNTRPKLIEPVGIELITQPYDRSSRRQTSTRTERSRPRNISRYRGTSLIRNTPLLGPYSSTLPRNLWWP